MAVRRETYYVKFGTFNPDAFSYGDAYVNTPKTGNATVRSSPIYVVDGVEKIPIFEWQPQIVAGIYANYNYGKPKVLENIDGFQVGFGLTSKETVNNPTDAEKYQKLILDTMIEKAQERLKAEVAKGKNSKVPTSQRTLIKEYISSDENNGGLKPLYTPATKPDPNDKSGKTRIPDPESPDKVYIKLDSYGKGASAKIKTVFYLPGGRQVNPSQYVVYDGDVDEDGKKVAKPGTIKPIISNFGGIYYGNHGQSPYCASIQLRIYEANFTPLQKGQRKRYIDDNTDDFVEDEDMPSTSTRKSFAATSGDDGDRDDNLFSKSKDPLKELASINRSQKNSDVITAQEPEGEEDDEEVKPPTPKPKKKKSSEKVSTEKQADKKKKKIKKVQDDE